MSFLARTPVIWTSFLLMLVIGVGFGLCRPMVGGAFLDMTSDPEMSRTIIATMSDAQRTAHAWAHPPTSATDQRWSDQPPSRRLTLGKGLPPWQHRNDSPAYRGGERRG